MKPADDLADFARNALAVGHERAAIGQALARAGWSEAEIAGALEAWVAEPGLPPVPRPRAYVSAREALVYGLLFLSLGTVAWHVVHLGFEAADRLLPELGEPAGGAFGGTQSIRWSVASLIAFLPIFLVLNRRVGRATRAEPGRRRSLVRKWFASLTLLIAVLTLLGDLVMTIYALLNGDMTPRFAAKAGLVAVMGGLVFAYYRDELDG